MSASLKVFLIFFFIKILLRVVKYIIKNFNFVIWLIEAWIKRLIWWLYIVFRDENILIFNGCSRWDKCADILIVIILLSLQ